MVSYGFITKMVLCCRLSSYRDKRDIYKVIYSVVILRGGLSGLSFFFFCHLLCISFSCLSSVFLCSPLFMCFELPSIVSLARSLGYMSSVCLSVFVQTYGLLLLKPRSSTHSAAVFVWLLWNSDGSGILIPLACQPDGPEEQLMGRAGWGGRRCRWLCVSVRVSGRVLRPQR